MKLAIHKIQVGKRETEKPNRKQTGSNFTISIL